MLHHIIKEVHGLYPAFAAVYMKLLIQSFRSFMRNYNVNLEKCSCPMSVFSEQYCISKLFTTNTFLSVCKLNFINQFQKLIYKSIYRNVHFLLYRNHNYQICIFSSTSLGCNPFSKKSTESFYSHLKILSDFKLFHLWF